MSCFLCNSSLGKKLVMSLTGCCLVLFLLFHMAMNLVALINPAGYNTICSLLGANWYAVVATVGLGALVVLHFVYAFILTINNYRARGTQRYAITANEPGVEWASKNMLVLGIIVILGLGLHLAHFWSKMMLVELMGAEGTMVAGEFVHATDGATLVAFTFSKWYNVVLYLAWLAALWFHLNHGVWSMFQTVGWANDTWYPRLKCASKVVSTLVILGFAAVIIGAFVMSIMGCGVEVCTEACCGHAH
ncbi:MAG: succinate dehydrogenase cytochrome b subunit [Alistipes sp.]|nr:succinate dehydrogenase cytochrome b subunit [Alistipes sp.]